MKNSEEFLIGFPIPVSKLPPSKHRQIPWLDIFKSFKVGYAQELSIQYQHVQYHIDRLVKERCIAKGEYTVTVRTDGSRYRRVFIIRHKLK